MNALIAATILATTYWLVAADEETTHVPQAQIVVDVYYEALCPHSQSFFTTQLHPSLDMLIEHNVRLNLIPFGKSTYKLDTNTNQWVFTCRHTDRECEGHRIQACALDLIREPITAYEYISCLMLKGRKDEPYPGQKCADDRENNINYIEIDRCAKSSAVVNKVRHYEQLTAALQPPLKSVPTIVFNGKYEQKDQDLAVKNFKAALCSYMDYVTLNITECLSASSAQGHTLTLTLLLSALAAMFVAYL